MIILAIKSQNKEKLLAIARRYKSGQFYGVQLCDWNNVPNTLRIFDRSGVASQHTFASWKDCIKYIFKS
jgi:hypothetical protein